MDPKIIAVLVLMMCCCCSSSVGAFFLIPTEKPLGPTGPTGPSGGGGGGYTYNFYIQVPEASPEHDLHLADIKIDGIRATSSQVTMHVQPDRYTCGTKTDACVSDATLGHIDAVGDSTWAAWELDTTSTGQKIFTITSPTKVSTFEISYQRPKYTPGWRITENGTNVVTETSNRGGAGTPTPVTYTYTIP
jgi:hypothetical protein